MKATNPHNGDVVAEFPKLSDEEIKKKIDRAWEAFLKYKKTDLNQRREKFSKLADVIEQNKESYAEKISTEMGKPLKEAIMEIEISVHLCRYIVDNLPKVLNDEVIKTEAKKSVVEHHPLGVIFIITPFNFPFLLFFYSAAFSLAIGNTIVNKPASQCPMTGKCVEDAMLKAGFDQGEYQLLFMDKTQSEVVISHPYVRGVGFTGSTKGGQAIASIAGKYSKKTVMELGGSDPCVIMKDANLDKAVEVIMKSRLMNAGQACNSAKRLIIDESIFDDFEKKLIESVKALKVGNPLEKDVTMGPLSSKKALDNVMKQLEEGTKRGAKILYGGKKPEGKEYEQGFYLMPTIVETDENNILAQEEVFAPVVVLMKYSDEKQIPKIANNTEYGLTGIIISENIEKAQEIGKEIECGGLFINAPVMIDPRIPFGGIKASGFGRECGPDSWHEFANLKTVWIQ